MAAGRHRRASLLKWIILILAALTSPGGHPLAARLYVLIFGRVCIAACSPSLARFLVQKVLANARVGPCRQAR